MEKGNRKKLCANEKFPLGICMQKSAAMAATTAPATASSFITEARELLHFHFWFGSLRCSFVIKKKWGGERERAKWKERREAIEHRPEYIRTHTPPRSGRRSLCSILIAFFHSLLSIGWNFRFTSLFFTRCLTFVIRSENIAKCEVKQIFDNLTESSLCAKSISFVWLLTN